MKKINSTISVSKSYFIKFRITQKLRVRGGKPETLEKRANQIGLLNEFTQRSRSLRVWRSIRRKKFKFKIQV